MARKKSKLRTLGINLILLTSIATLNFLGVSYSHWNDNLQITTSLNTGRIQLSYDSSNKQGAEIYPRQIGNTIFINGIVESNYNGHFKLRNTGTIPLKINVGNKEPLYDDGIIEVWINEEVGKNQKLRPGHHIQLRIKAKNPGEITGLSLGIPYKQWNQ